MTNLLDRGYTIMNRIVEPIAAATVRYIRATTEISSALPATFSAPRIDSIDEGGATNIGRQYTFELKRSELLWEGREDRPRVNDVIEWIVGGLLYRFEVQPEQGNPEAPAVDPRSEWVPASVKLKAIE